MKMKTGLFTGFAAMLLMMVILVGCSSNESKISESSPTIQATATATPAAFSPTESPKSSPAVDNTPKEKITLSMFTTVSGLTDDLFDEVIKKPVESKFSFITIELIRGDKERTIESLVVANQVPDIIYTTNAALNTFIDLGVALDLNEQVKKQNIDLSKFKPVFLDSIKINAKNNELYALPITSNFSALYYNKDIFDQFGIEYPKSGMTWMDAMELGKKLNRESNGIVYTGLDANTPNFLASQFSLPYYDPATMKSTYSSDEWRKFLELYKMLKDAQSESKEIKIGVIRANFLKNKTLAMLPDFGSIIGTVNDAENLNWGLTSFPTIPGGPDTGLRTDVHAIAVSSKTKYMDESVQVIKLLTDAESQTQASKMGRVTVLQDPKIDQVFASEVPDYKDIAFGELFKLPSAPVYPADKFYNASFSVLMPMVQDILDGKSDINTATREAEEKANQLIDQIIQSDSKK